MWYKLWFFFSSAEMMRDGGMKSLIQGFYLIKSLCMNVIEAEYKNMNIIRKSQEVMTMKQFYKKNLTD